MSSSIYNATCWCYEDDGAMKQCKHFQNKIWNHPCEHQLSDSGVETKLIQLAAEDPEPIQNTLLLTDDSEDDIDVFTKSLVVKRTTRSPMATEIQQWRHELNDTLPSLSSPLRTDLTCQTALYDALVGQVWAIAHARMEIQIAIGFGFKQTTTSAFMN
uniref:SWIM-type domain-containing protein n=1 Tax=Panagrolaimus sp. JU765 TaxID=591449 RepID=A0AC34RJ15_9BILA